MDLASLQVFQTVAREQSFSRAAEKLYRTQPAISIAMRKLEEWVGQPLFVRGSGARTLTDAGVLLLEYAERMLNLREEISKGMKQLQGLERGQISLGVNESSIHALLPALARYQADASRDSDSRAPRFFARRAARSDESSPRYRRDFLHPGGARIGDGGVLPGFACAGGVAGPSAGEAARSEYCRARRRELRRAHRRVALPAARAADVRAHTVCRCRMDIELPTIESIKMFVEMKKGVAIVPQMCVEREIANGLLCELRLKEMRIERRLYLVVSAGPSAGGSGAGVGGHFAEEDLKWRATSRKFETKD